MMYSTSVRKRTSDGVYEESFTNPQFEEGRKKVPQAELEHVSPTEESSGKLENMEQSVSSELHDARLIKKQVSEHLQKISENINQIFDLVSEIQFEKENIKRVLKNLRV